ncbi:MAG: VC0807 family protein [Acidimicrobiales bacterium]
MVPLVLFLSFLRPIGTTGALIAALGWSVAVVIHRRRAGREVPGLVLLSTIGLAAKTVLALATGSLVVYFLQPTITTAMVGVAFLASVLMGKPLAERLAGDFCPFDPETAEHPLLRLFFARLSLWAATSLANAAVTLWLLFTQSVTTFVIIKSFMGPTFTAATLGIAAVWFRFRTRQDVCSCTSPRRWISARPTSSFPSWRRRSDMEVVAHRAGNDPVALRAAEGIADLIELDVHRDRGHRWKSGTQSDCGQRGDSGSAGICCPATRCHRSSTKSSPLPGPTRDCGSTSRACPRTSLVVCSNSPSRDNAPSWCRRSRGGSSVG